MTKKEFVSNLETALSSLSQEEREKTVSFYSELIDDRMEDGLTEEAAVSAMDSVSSIAEKIIYETPISTLIKTKKENRGNLSALTIVLLIIGSPIWLSLLITIASVVFSLYVVIWSVVASLAITVLAIGISGVGSLVLSGLVFAENPIVAVGMFGIALALVGFTILLYYPVKMLIIGCVKFSKFIAVKIKMAIFKGEA